VLLTHLGHSCLLVEAAGARVLIDPGAFSSGFEELTGLDAVMITHQHPDHLDPERLPMLLEANDGARLLAEPEAAAELVKVGLDARGLHVGESAELGALRVRAVGGEHALIHADVARIGNVGVLLGAEGEPTLFHPGDSYAETPAGVDILALPLNAPWAAARETADFLRAVRPAAAFPIHDGLLADRGRAIYLRVLGGLAPDCTNLIEVAGAGAVEVGAEVTASADR
jgi:L-ascorbate metabolism protein UlaG (beta-lactamase superfamily)